MSCNRREKPPVAAREGDGEEEEEGCVERRPGGRHGCEVCRCERERGELLLREEEKKEMEGRKERDVKEK